MTVQDFLEFCQYRVCQITCILQKDTVSLPHLPCTGITGKSSGSGFLIEQPTRPGQLLIVTNFHVVANAINILASFADHKPVEVIVLTVNPQFDLAVLILGESVEFPAECEPFVLGDTKNLTTDTKLYAGGFPLGMPQLQVQQGFRTGFNVANEDVLLQHSALLNPGNSGGPLAVKHPDNGYVVVGVNNAIVAKAQGLDFAILVERLVWILDVFEKTDTVVQTRFQLGFSYQHGSEFLRETILRPTSKKGIFITKTYKHSLKGVGFDALQQHDYLHSLDGMEVSDNGTVFDPRLLSLGAIPLHIYLSREEYGSIQKFDILRKADNCKEYHSQEVEGHLVWEGVVKTPRSLYVPYERPEFEIVSGMVLADMTENARKEFQIGVAQGRELEPAVIVVNLLPQGEVSRDSAPPGTIIRRLNWKDVHSIADIRYIFTKLWRSEMDTVVFTTAEGTIITLPLVTLHEDNEMIRTIYGDSAASRSLPHCTDSVAVVPEELEEELDEVAMLEKELHGSLGI